MNRKLMLIAMLLGDFAEVVDETILNTGIYSIRNTFGAPLTTVQLVMSLYILGVSVFTPLSIPVVNAFGVRKTFIFAYMVFVIGTLLCALSPNIGSLVLFRVLQAAGASCMMPVTRVTLRKYFKASMLRINATMGTIVMLGFCLGPVIGGAILSFCSWRYLFAVTLIPLVFSFFLCCRYFPKERMKCFELDLPGYFIYMLPTASLAVFFAFQTMATFIFALIVLVLSIYVYNRHVPEKSTKFLLIPRGIFKNRLFSYYCAGAFAFRMSLGAALFIVPSYFQHMYGYTPLGAGIFLVAYGVGAISGRLSISRLQMTDFQAALCTLVLFSGLVLVSIIPDSVLIFYAVLLMMAAGFFGSMENVLISNATLVSVKKIHMVSSVVLFSSMLKMAEGLSITLVTLITFGAISSFSFSTVFICLSVVFSIFLVKKAEGVKVDAFAK